MQRLPNEYWIKYMLLFSGLSQKDIRGAAELLGMVPPSLEYISHVKRVLDKTKPKPFGLQFEGARPWIRRQRVMSLARSDADAVAARELLGETKVRPVLEALILSEMPLDEMAAYTKEITGISVKPSVIKMFQHYFWNRNLLTIEQWYSFFKLHPRGDMLRACYSQGPEFALWKVGYRVDVPQEEVLKTVFHESAMRFIETNTMDNDKNTAMTAKLWAENIFKASEVLNKSGDGVREILSELKQISIRLGRRNITSLDDLKKETEESQNEQ